MLLKTDKNYDPDNLAEKLAFFAKMGKDMPPSWDGCGITHGFGDPREGYTGRILPGRGIYINDDLKHLGITKPIPNVYEYSLTQRLADLYKKDIDNECKAEMCAISTYDGIIAARTLGAQDLPIAKVSYTTVASVWSSVFQSTGYPVAGTYSAAASGAVITNASTGAWTTGLRNPASGNKKYLLTVGYTAVQQLNAVLIVDMLVGGQDTTAPAAISQASASGQTINTATLTRYYLFPGRTPNTVSDGAISSVSATTTLTSNTANFNSITDINRPITIAGAGAAGATLITTITAVSNTTTATVNNAASTTVSGAVVNFGPFGAGVNVTNDIITASGATNANLTLSYTNQALTSGQSTGAQAYVSGAVAMIAQRLAPTPLGPFTMLASGDYGVSSIQTWTLSISTGTAGAVAFVLYYPLHFLPGIGAGVYTERDSTVQIDGLTQIQMDTSNTLGCLNAFVLTNTTSTGISNWFFRTCEG
jgi:hypothetical protein